MARARNIKPGLFKNEILGVADPLLTLLFEGLWVLADREGRLEDRPLRIKAEIFPYRDGLDIDPLLNWLHSNKFIRRYSVAGRRCIVVCEFVKHQNPHKNETESDLPAPEGECTTPEEIGTTPEIIGSAPADSLSSDSLSSDSLRDAGKPAPSPTRLITFKTFVDQCKSENRKPIPDDHYIREFCRTAGISNDMLALNWLRFREEHLTGTRSGKKYKDWPGVFANSVKDRWYRLWLVNNEGDATWTNEGLQAKRVAEAEAA